MTRENAHFNAVFLTTTFGGILRRAFAHNPLIDQLMMVGQLTLPLLALPAIVKRALTGKEYLPVYLLAYLLFLALLSVHPLADSLVHGGVGLVIHSVFWIFLGSYLCIYRFKATNAQLILFFTSCFAESILASLQSDRTLKLPELLGNPVSSNDAVPAMVGEAVRAYGTFQYMAGLASFGLFTAFWACYILKISRSAFTRLAVIAIGIYCSLLSGSRASVISYLLIVGAFAILELPGRTSARLGALGMSVFLLVNALLRPFNQSAAMIPAVGNFVIRLEKGGQEFSDRLLNDLYEPTLNKVSFDYFGIGLGATYQGANRLFKTPVPLHGIPFEGELFRLVLEGGYLLLITRFALLALVLSQFQFTAGFKLFLFLLLGLFSSLVFNSYSSIYLASGLILLNSAYSR